MVTCYSTFLLSAAINKGLEAANAFIAKATINASSHAPGDGFERNTLTAGLYAEAAFIQATSGPLNYVLTGLGNDNFTDKYVANPSVVLATLSKSAGFFADPTMTLVGVGRAVAVAGVGAQASVFLRAAERIPASLVLRVHYRIVGYLEDFALQTARKATDAGDTKTTDAAHPSALGVALVLGTRRASGACLLTATRLLYAVAFAVLKAIIGVLIANSTPKPVAHFDWSDFGWVDVAADLIGAQHPAPLPRPPYNWSTLSPESKVYSQNAERKDIGAERPVPPRICSHSMTDRRCGLMLVSFSVIFGKTDNHANIAARLPSVLQTILQTARIQNVDNQTLIGIISPTMRATIQTSIATKLVSPTRKTTKTPAFASIRPPVVFGSRRVQGSSAWCVPVDAERDAPRT